MKQLGIDEETLVLFNADNGAETVHVDWMRRDHRHDASGGWRGMKRDGWEGGHRVPFIARWPNKIPAGRVSNQLTNTTDIFATLASVVGYELADDAAVDSFDMLPALLGLDDETKPIRPHMLTQSFRGEFQLRVGDWKYLDHTGSRNTTTLILRTSQHVLWNWLSTTSIAPEYSAQKLTSRSTCSTSAWEQACSLRS